MHANIVQDIQGSLPAFFQDLSAARGERSDQSFKYAVDQAELWAFRANRAAGALADCEEEIAALSEAVRSLRGSLGAVAETLTQAVQAVSDGGRDAAVAASLSGAEDIALDVLMKTSGAVDLDEEDTDHG